MSTTRHSCLALFITLSCVETASAARLNCKQGFGSRDYKKSFAERTDELNLAWSEADKDCDKFDELQDIYDIAKPEIGPTRDACKNAGSNEANAKFFEERAESCSTLGKQFGAQFGLVLGQEYCAAVQAGYIDEATGDFEISATDTCISVVHDYVGLFCPKVLENIWFGDRVIIDCHLSE